MNRQQRRMAKSDAFMEAVACHQAGDIASAERLYRRVLATNPSHAPALSNLGMALLSQGRTADAIVAQRRAIAIKPDFVQAMLNLAEGLRLEGDLEEAAATYRRVAQIAPPSGPLQNSLGVLLFELGRPDEAMEAFRLAVRLDPAHADAYANQARVLMHLGEPAEAVVALRHALDLTPQVGVLHSDLGLALMRSGDTEGAIACYHKAIVLDPGLSSAHLNLAAALVEQDEPEAAVRSCRSGLALAPNDPDLHCTLAAALKKLNDLDGAAASARRAVALQPRHLNAWFNLGTILERQGALDEAISAQRRALEIDPDFAPAELKLGQSLLAQGDYARGFHHHEARWRTGERVSHFNHLLDQPRWNGEALAGRTILLHWEQGFGDTLQSLRYVPMVAERGGKVLLIVQPQLQGLVADMPGITSIATPAEVPPFDVHCPLSSLPMAFGTTIDTIPAPIPYLKANPELSASWRARLDGPALRVGLVWAGNANYKGDAHWRPIPLKLLHPLLDVPDMQLFSLQRDLRAGDAEWLAGPGAAITQLGPALTDFSVTAAALSALDLLVSIDTSVCHLAGALGIPVWLQLHYAPDWRWAIDAERSRWYPTVRLMRQPALHDWPGLISRLAAELASLAAERKVGALP